jgi:aminopeptidase
MSALQDALRREIRRAGGISLHASESDSPDVLIHIVSPGDETSQPPMPWTAILDRSHQAQLRFVVTACTTLPEVPGRWLSLDNYEAVLRTACFLDQEDPEAAWRDASVRQASLIDRLRGVHDLRFTTPAGTDLRLSVAGRTWINGDGHENMPDGEVYTAPIEDAVQGVFCFDAHSIEGARLTFRAGRVVDATARKGEEMLMHKLDQDAGARILGEVGIGCNERITQRIGHPLFDEKIAGTFHVALGASLPATGGRNQSGVHWDLVCDLRNGGRIEADGRVVSENGRWVV